MPKIGTSEMRAACDRFLRGRGQSVKGFSEITSAEYRARQKPNDQRHLRNSVERAAREIERGSRG